MYLNIKTSLFGRELGDCYAANKKSLQFHVERDTIFTPKKVNAGLARDALVHVISAFYMYNVQKYKLK